MLDISNLTYRIGGRALFQGASLSVAAGQHIGFVGRNGAGKSTLFKLILGELHPDSGEISIPPRTRVGSVAQDPPDGEGSLIDWVLEQDTERAALMATVEDHEIDPQLMADAHERLLAIDAHSAPSRAAAILAGLGFSPERQLEPSSALSGGWRMRVALAGALFARADMLLLDEPTNHLDLEATIWLQNYLRTFPGTLIIISHDRELLNSVPERIVHLDQMKLVPYGGNYDRFEQVRREKAELAAKFEAKQDEKRKHLQAFVDRFRAKASKAAQAQSRLKMLEKMGPPINVVEEKPVSFDFPAPTELPPPLIRIEKATAGYADTPVLSHIDLRLDMDDRVALLGANGNGKSTLAKIFAGRLELMGGSMFRAGKLRIGYFAQHQTEELDMAGTPFTHMRDLMPDKPPSAVRAQLGRFAFGQDRADVTVANLSGGEKARLLFALMSRDAPHLMILDEPTNHLDIDAREALVAALNDYEGAVVLISHDPHLIALTVDRLWLVADGAVKPFDGDLDDYRQLLLQQAGAARRANKAAAAERKVEQAAPPPPKSGPRLSASTLRRKVQDAERKMDELNKKKAALETKLADPSLYAKAAKDVPGLQRDMATLIAALASTEAEWLAASEQLERETASG